MRPDSKVADKPVKGRAMSDDVVMTAEDAAKLETELQRLRSVDRPAIIQAIKEAREKGDLTENAEYDAARERQGFVEGRIQELEGKISALQIIDPVTVDAAGRVVKDCRCAFRSSISNSPARWAMATWWPPKSLRCPKTRARQTVIRALWAWSCTPNEFHYRRMMPMPRSRMPGWTS